ncbi:MAG: hypothetical protein JWP11_2845 [Frankiales bacterium]|nr:hypothetical protein [Frankiales bacterium]
MTWLRTDDQALTHPRVLHLRSLADPIATGEAVIGWVMLAASWSGAQNTDGFIAEGAGMFASPEHWQHLSTFALKVGLITRTTAAVRREYGGQRGWMVRMGEGEVFHLLSRKEIELRKEKRNITRRVPEKIEMLLRDGDQCRYCGDPVNEFDRKSGKMREQDHPDPTDASYVVVACLECNRWKAGRPVEEWVEDGGRPLLPPPTERGLDVFLRPSTVTWLHKHNVVIDVDSPPSASVARTASNSSDAATPSAADQARDDADPMCGSDPPSTTGSIAGQDMPGRVRVGIGSGSGLDGLSSGSSDPPRRRSRARGSRGRRGRPSQQDERSA